MPHSVIAKRTRTQARALRRRPTDAERKLWYLLRSLKPMRIHFRRQAPIGIYVADFAWHAGKLVIELDGSQHADARQGYDLQRTAWLESQGYRVLRFWNNDVLKTPRSVGEAILEAAHASEAWPKNPTPSPSPPSGCSRPSSTGYGGGEPAAASGEGIVS
jgi:very-short-patch-repair endonuclease